MAHTRWCKRGARLMVGAAALAACWLQPAVLADTLGEPPASRAGEVVAVPEVDLSGAEPAAREAIVGQRRATAALLADAGASPRDLAEGYGRLGALYQVHGMITPAEAAYANARALEPGRFRWAYYAAFLAAESGRHDTAVERYTAAQGLRPDYAPLDLRMGESLLAMGHLEAAAAALEAAAADPGLRPRALYHLAQVDLLRRRPAAAIARLEEVLEATPDAGAAHYALARALRAAGRDAEARDHMARSGRELPAAADPLVTELEALDRGARPLFAAGLEAGRERDFAAAADAFARGLAIEPGNLNARVSYARALFLAGKPERSREELERVLGEAPGHPLALFLGGLLLEESGEAEAAMARYREVLAVEPAHYGAHYLLGNHLYRAGDYPAAARHYQAALEANPDIPPARLLGLLARARAGLDDREARRRLEALVREHPQQTGGRYALIRLLALSEDPQVRDVERARQLVNALVQEAFTPPHVELQALVAAAVGGFAQAAELQEQVLPALAWMDPGLAAGAEAALAAYREERLPAVRWYDETAVLRPPPTDPRLMMMEYPAPVPY